MAYSLKDIGDRVAALEKAGSSSWTKGSNTNGNWVKESTTGLIIQWGSRPTSTTATRIFPIPFKNPPIIVQYVSANVTTDTYYTFMSNVWAITNSSYKFNERQAMNGNYYWSNWIAIGYLITDRLLNIYYIAKSFTSSWIFSRFFFTEETKEV